MYKIKTKTKTKRMEIYKLLELLYNREVDLTNWDYLLFGNRCIEDYSDYKEVYKRWKAKNITLKDLKSMVFLKKLQVFKESDQFLNYDNMKDVVCRLKEINNEFNKMAKPLEIIQEEPLFTTEDGYKVFKGDKCYNVRYNTKIEHLNDVSVFSKWNGTDPYSKYFYKKKNAKKWLKEVDFKTITHGDHIIVVDRFCVSGSETTTYSFKIKGNPLGLAELRRLIDHALNGYKEE